MKHVKLLEQFINEGKPKGAPDWHDSDAPDAEGRFKELSPEDLAAWLIKTRKKDLRKITGSLNQQIVFNRNEDPGYADKMEKTRREVYKQLGREDLMDNKQTHIDMKYIKPLNEAPAFGSHDKNDYSDEMSYGQLERCMDYAKIIRERIEAGQSLDPWMHSQIAVAENELNSVFDALDGDDGVVESERDWNDKRRGPHPYTATLSDEDEKKKEAQMKKQAEMDDDDPEAYKEMPGSEEAREQGKVKTSKHVKSYHELYGDDEETNEAKVEVERYVRSHGKKPKGWGRWMFSYNRDGSNMFEIPTAMNWSDAQKWAKSKAKENGKDYVYVMESLNEEKAEGDRGPIDDEKIETALKKKEEETGVPMEFLRIIMRRGMAAWRTGHRPGATQQQWGYARVGSFLTKQPGTWGGADADVAKEVRDGGYDKKLKKG